MGCGVQFGGCCNICPVFIPNFRQFVHPTLGNLSYYFGYWFDARGEIQMWNTVEIEEPSICNFVIRKIPLKPFMPTPVTYVDFEGTYAMFENPFATTPGYPTVYRAFPGTPYFDPTPGDQFNTEASSLFKNQSVAVPIIRKGCKNTGFFFQSGHSTLDSPPPPYDIPPMR